jgi:molybdopterin-guanine dinucleotide biosynthesis protein A
MKDKDVTFAILAGGLSSRMGQDKALLPIQGEPLIQRVVNRGKAISDNFLVITNRPEAYPFLQVPLVRDILSIKGPLVGLYTALHVSESAFLILVGCDMPFINLAMLSFQLSVLEHEDVDVVIPKHANGFEPLHAVYRRETCLDLVKSAIDEGERSLIGWFNRACVREIPENRLLSFDPDLRAFMNLNTPQDYQEAELFSLYKKRDL